MTWPVSASSPAMPEDIDRGSIVYQEDILRKDLSNSLLGKKISSATLSWEVAAVMMLKVIHGGLKTDHPAKTPYKLLKFIY